MPEHINPSAIPGAELRPDMVEIGAREIKSIGNDVSDQGGTLLTTWQRLAQHYEAPEAATLFSVMDPVKTNAETFGSNVASVSSALTTFAAEIEPIKAELARIKAEAEDFVVSIAGGVEKKTYSRAGVHTSTIEWHEDQDSVDANNALIGRVNEQMVLLWAAERKCANAIYDIIGFPHVEAATDANPNGYGVSEIPEGAETPWGAAVERSESCGEQAVGAVKGFVWDGVVVGGIWGTVEGLGSLVLGYNPQTGEWFDGDTYGAAWSNLGMLAVGLASTGLVTLPLSQMDNPVGEFMRRGQQTLINAGKGLVAWDKWKDDPAAAAGESVFNVATLIVPVGAATAPVRASASTAAAAIRATARVVDLIDPASLVIKGGVTGTRVALPLVGDLARSLDLGRTLDLYDLGMTGTKIDLPDLTTTTPTKIDIPDTGGPDITVTSPRAEAEISVPVRDVTAGADVPVREPALVGAGDSAPGVHTHTDHGGSTVTGGDGSSSTDGSSGPPDRPASVPTDSGGDQPWNPEMGDPVFSDADYGPGFTRDTAIRGDDIDPAYGDPRADHGRLGDAYLPPNLDDVAPEVRELVTRPDEPYGTDGAGRPLSREEWEARYTDASGRPVYPGNDGAVPGRRYDFTSVDEFTTHYGDLLDRMGGRQGDFMAFPGTPFEARSLPGSSLGQPYLTMQLTGDLPPNLRLEVSEVAPAFGREGGGLQVRVLDADGTALSVKELEERGIIDVVGDTERGASAADSGATPHYSDWSDQSSDAATDRVDPASDPDGSWTEEGARRRPRDIFDSAAQDAWAREVYDEILADPQVTDTISANLSSVERTSGTVGFTPEEVAQIRDHLMVEEHLLDNYDTGGLVLRRYDPSEDIAEAWLRLRDGSFRDSDIVLLEHELAESRYLREHPGATYREAHNAANRLFNWEDLTRKQ